MFLTCFSHEECTIRDVHCVSLFVYGFGLVVADSVREVVRLFRQPKRFQPCRQL